MKIKNDLLSYSHGKYNMLKQNIVSLLDCLGYCFRWDKEQELMLLCSKNDLSDTVVEKVEPEIAKKIWEYNYFKNKGDLESKRNVLRSIANDLEPKREIISNLSPKISTSLFWGLNKLQIRHNTDEGRKIIAKFTIEELETTYDYVYQTALLAFFIVEDKTCYERINEIKTEYDNSTQPPKPPLPLA